MGLGLLTELVGKTDWDRLHRLALPPSPGWTTRCVESFVMGTAYHFDVLLHVQVALGEICPEGQRRLARFVGPACFVEQHVGVDFAGDRVENAAVPEAEVAGDVAAD